jgi:hypothetical protein
LRAKRLPNVTVLEQDSTRPWPIPDQEVDQIVCCQLFPVLDKRADDSRAA